jgi:CelD/BcsL family acetyltransferase involved in cellulose biosynthesis
MTTYQLCTLRELDAGLAEAWAAVQESLPDLASPFFRPEFAAACAGARSDGRLLILEDGGRPVGFFPFQSGPMRTARPIGGAVSDYQGVVAPPDLEWSPVDLLRAARVRAWVFDHLLASQRRFAPFCSRLDRSLTVDLNGGYDAYAAASRQSGSKHIQKIEAMVRKLEREVGELRFQVHTTDPAVLRAVFDWKSAQLRASGKPDLFAHSWSRALLERIAATSSAPFSGVLSTLYAGSTLIAAHLGMRSRTVWHYWFPVYSEEHSRYSPGMVLLLRIVQAAPGLGLRLVDMGKGESFYKERFANGSIAVGEGRVEAPSILNAGRRLLQRAEALGKGRPLAAPLTFPMRLLRRLEYLNRIH